jgi:hypothetical protein
MALPGAVTLPDSQQNASVQPGCGNKHAEKPKNFEKMPIKCQTESIY